MSPHAGPRPEGIIHRRTGRRLDPSLRILALLLVAAFVSLAPPMASGQTPEPDEPKPEKKLDVYIVYQILASGTKEPKTPLKVPPAIAFLSKELTALPYGKYDVKEAREIDFDKSRLHRFVLPEKLGRCEVKADKNDRVQFVLFFGSEKKGVGGYALSKKPIVMHNKKFRTDQGEQYIFVIVKKPEKKEKKDKDDGR